MVDEGTPRAAGEAPQAGEAPDSASLLGLVRGFASTFTALIQNRLELLGVELQEEVLRVLVGLVLALAAVLAAFAALVFIAVALLIAAGEAYRLPVALGLVAFFFALALLGGWLGLRVLRAKPRLFDATLTELERDRAGFREVP